MSHTALPPEIEKAIDAFAVAVWESTVDNAEPGAELPARAALSAAITRALDARSAHDERVS